MALLHGAALRLSEGNHRVGRRVPWSQNMPYSTISRKLFAPTCRLFRASEIEPLMTRKASAMNPRTIDMTLVCPPGGIHSV